MLARQWRHVGTPSDLGGADEGVIRLLPSTVRQRGRPRPRHRPPFRRRRQRRRRPRPRHRDDAPAPTTTAPPTPTVAPTACPALPALPGGSVESASKLIDVDIDGATDTVRTYATSASPVAGDWHVRVELAGGGGADWRSLTTPPPGRSPCSERRTSDRTSNPGRRDRDRRSS